MRRVRTGKGLAGGVKSGTADLEIRTGDTSDV